MIKQFKVQRVYDDGLGTFWFARRYIDGKKHLFDADDEPYHCYKITNSSWMRLMKVLYKDQFRSDIRSSMVVETTYTFWEELPEEKWQEFPDENLTDSSEL